MNATLTATLIGSGFAFVPAASYSVNGLLAYSLRPLHFTVQLFYAALGMILIAVLFGLGELLLQGRTQFLQLDAYQITLLFFACCFVCGENVFQTLAFTHGSP